MAPLKHVMLSAANLLIGFAARSYLSAYCHGPSIIISIPGGPDLSAHADHVSPLLELQLSNAWPFADKLHIT